MGEGGLEEGWRWGGGGRRGVPSSVVAAADGYGLSGYLGGLTLVSPTEPP